MTDTDTVTDLRRELDKALGTLLEVGNYLTHQAEMNAALHCSSDRVMYSPLHAKVTLAISHAHHALDRTTPTPEEEAVRTMARAVTDAARRATDPDQYALTPAEETGE